MYSVREEPLGYQQDKLVEVVPLPQPYAIMVDPSGACNFRCCFCPCNNAFEFKKDRHQIMKFSTFQKVVDGLLQFPNKVPVIDLYGLGEPLLNPKFVDMVRYLKQADCCSMIRTTTNGSLLTPELCNELVDSGLDYIKISIEGMSSEDYQKLCDVKIDFDALVEKIRYLYTVSRGKLEIGTKIISSAFNSQVERQRYLDLFSPISDYTYIRNVQLNWAEFDEMVIPDGSEDGVYAKN